MKQVYIEPDIKTEDLESTELLAGSGMTGQIGETIEIGNGGDDDGTHEPEAKLNIVFHDIWAEDEETENDRWD